MISTTAINITSIAPQPGRGTLRSMPMHVAANQNTGASFAHFPLALTPSRQLTPTLALTYHANQGNSIFGMGFALQGIVNITRSTRQGGVPRYDETDIFIVNTFGELTAVKEDNKMITYRPRFDTEAAIIEYHKDEQSWLIRAANGINHHLGVDDHARVSHVDRGIFQWWVTDSLDMCANKISYTYLKNETACYPDKIQYGNYYAAEDVEQFAFCCVLDYGDMDAQQQDAQGNVLWQKADATRHDQFTHYRAGFSIAIVNLCRRIALYHVFEGTRYLVKYWNLQYRTDLPISLLMAMQEIGCRSNSRGQYIVKALPETIFDFMTVQNTSLPMLPFALEVQGKLPTLGSQYQWVDLYRDGLPGILYSNATSAWYWRSEGNGKFSAPQSVTPFPQAMDFNRFSCHIMPLGNEQQMAFVISNDEQTGYYLIDAEKINVTNEQYCVAFSPYQYFTQAPLALSYATNEIMDLNGTGKSDIVVLDTFFPHYYPASETASEGYGAPQALTLPFDFPINNDDPNAMVTFVAIFGDGLLHRVKVNRDGIDIWPNLGYGNFAAKIHWNLPQMGSEFDPKCVFFADIDGSGACDFVYTSTEGLSIFLNYGQGFLSTALTFTFPEAYTHEDQLLFADFFGTGTTGVIFVKNDINQNRYYSGSFAIQKPYLLSTITQASATITQLCYDTSITSYLADRKNEKLSPIRLPFALPVLSKTKVIDPMTQVTIEKTYDYHFGEYNFSERQFCGFSYVAEVRCESMGDLKKQIQDSHSKRWFYNRTFSTVSQSFVPFDVSSQTAEDIKQQYYQEDETTDSVPLLNQDQEACFALHGYCYREEVWGEGNLLAMEVPQAPLSVELHQYTVRHEPVAPGQRGIFIIQRRDTYHLLFEQSNAEPRISREVNLLLDSHNRILLKVNLQYGRTAPIPECLMDDISLDDATAKRLTTLQKGNFALYHQATYASVVTASDFQYLHLIAEAKTFDLSLQFSQQKSTQTFAVIQVGVQSPTTLLQHYQKYYWDDRQATLAPLGTSGKIALIHHEQYLLGTDLQAQAWYQPVLQTHETLAEVLTENGYLCDRDASSASPQWWQPDAVRHYGDAKQYYQLTAITQMPEYGEACPPSLVQRTQIMRDSYQMSVINITQYLTLDKFFVTDYLIDYQAMQPCQLIDHNKNIQLILRDPLGMIIATTKYGQLEDKWIGNPIVGDSDHVSPMTAIQLSDLAFTLTQAFENISLENIIANSMVLLGEWLAVYYYHHTSDEQQPRYSLALTQPYYRYRAKPLLTDMPDAPIGISIHYVDSFNHPLQIKHKANDTHDDQSWLTSGIHIHSESGKILQQSLPEYSATFICESALTGADPGKTLFNAYNVGFELIQQTLANGDQRQLIYAAWYQVYYDQNVMRNKKNNALDFSGSTQIHFFDSAGNTTGDLKITSAAHPNKYVLTTSCFDVLRRPISHQDSRLAQPNLTIDYNLLSEEVSHDSVDRSKETFLRNHRRTIIRRHLGDWIQCTQHDSWQRPLTLSVGTAATPGLVPIEAWCYGEMQASPESVNACGQVISFANEDGFFYDSIFDLGANCIEYHRSVLLPAMTPTINQTLTSDAMPHAYNESCNNWVEETFSFTVEYDVSGNILAEQFPNGKSYMRHYNILGQLDAIYVGVEGSGPTVVATMQYHATGNLLNKTFAQNITTQYQYDEQTQRLTRIHTQNAMSQLLQDQTISFDPVGNIVCTSFGELQLPLKGKFTHIQQAYESQYRYDDRYRLSAAEGVELSQQLIRSDARFIPQKICSDLSSWSIQRYQQKFYYDGSNNLTQILHAHDDASSWKIDFQLNGNNNQFSTLTESAKNTPIPLADAELLYDAAGNLQRLDASTHLQWDHTNQLRKVSTACYPSNADSMVENNTNEYYAYRGTAFQDVPFQDTQKNSTFMPYSPTFFGQSSATAPQIDDTPFAQYGTRLYKITCFEKEGSIEVIEQLFLGNYERKRIFEISKNAITVATPSLIRHTLRIQDEETVVASHHLFIIDTHARESTQINATGVVPQEQWVYHLTDQLHSSVLDIDQAGDVIGVEAYQAYGQIAYLMTCDAQQLSIKDYHYSSQMRDQVSGLYYYGARYYVPQFGRWLAPDPAGLIDGLNVYGFVDQNPISFWDVDGFQKNLTKQYRKAMQRKDNVFSKVNLNQLSSSEKLLKQMPKELISDFKKVAALVHNDPPLAKEKFKGGWRDVSKNMDEMLSTATIHDLVIGAGKYTREKAVQEFFALASMFRLPTEMVGHNVKGKKGRKDSILQHPSGENAMYVKSKRTNHGTFDEDRVAIAYKAYEKAKDNKLHHMLYAAVVFTLNMTAPPLAQGNTTLSSVTPRQKEIAHQRREVMKRCTVSLGKFLGSRVPTGRRVEASAAWTPSRDVRTVSPPRKLTP